MDSILSNSVFDTYKIAKKSASEAKPGDIFLLQGDLGSGKTTFAQGFAKALGVKQNVTSPTFVVMKEYPVSGHNGINKLIHIDCYRFESISDFESIGFSELMQTKNDVMIIEWPEKAKNFLEGYNTKTIKFEYISENERKISY